MDKLISRACKGKSTLPSVLSNHHLRKWKLIGAIVMYINPLTILFHLETLT